MKPEYQTYWESCWQGEDSDQLQIYLAGWKNYHGKEIKILQEHQVKSVLDHLTVADAKKAIEELVRITRKGGLIVISFDSAEEEDFSEEYIEIEPGTMQYVSGERAGMLFHPYEWEEIERLLEAYEIVEKWTTCKGEQMVAVRK